MIASGLCMMGGCFAQDTSSAAVETYWHAHAIAPSTTHLFSTPLEMVSVIAAPYFAFGRLENAKNINSAQSGQVLFWGAWDGSPRETLLLGVKGGAFATLQSLINGVHNLSLSAAEPIAWDELLFEKGTLWLSSPAGSTQKDCSSFQTFEPAGWSWYARISGTYAKAHVAAYAAQSSQAGWRFLIQPMLSASGASAFFDVVNSELIEQ